MKRTIITALAALALLVPATPAQAGQFPPSWDCKFAGEYAWNCKASFVITVGTGDSQYVWASKMCKKRVQDVAMRRGAANPPEVMGGVRPLGDGRYRCTNFWQMNVIR